NELGSPFQPKTGTPDSVAGAFALYNDIRDSLKQDDELVKMFRSSLTGDCWPDTNLITLTVDFCFYIFKEYNKTSEVWEPVDYTPGLTVEQWAELLKDPSVFNQRSLEIMKRFKAYGGAATCTQLSVKYGEEPGFYNINSTALAQHVIDKTNCNRPDGTAEGMKLWPVLYVGRRAGKEDAGNYVWKLRDELAKALDQADLTNINLYASPTPGDQERGYWWLNANPKIWSFADTAVGKEQNYTHLNENGNKRRVYQNFLNAKVGDLVIGYESNPVKQIVALAKVTKNDGKAVYFEKTEALTNPIDYSTLHDCPELQQMEYFAQPKGSLFKLTKGEYEFIMDLIREENLSPSASKPEYEKYDKTAFLNEVYMTSERYDSLVSLLEHKLNVILQGAPGVGKTYAAKRLAYSMMGEKDKDRVKTIQFHQNYSYEDFIAGYKPKGTGFELQKGVFYQFCETAANSPKKKFFFIIDEINRGNMSKIFGELLMLIERDYRGKKLTLPCEGLPFSVPENLYIIGMMNTADRSLAMIDFALRRRFGFSEIEPAFDSVGFEAYQKQFENKTFDALIKQIQELNVAIVNDDALGKGFRIGHSYFCERKPEEKTGIEGWLSEIVEYDILPMLREYWFDEPAKVEEWEKSLRGIFK
ncbi:MAG TPA: AAA family ATPase, partial [Oscillospiraceae bacterium]|nr:AAA family ATPase [Oscillospiraceae bacterium]